MSASCPIGSIEKFGPAGPLGTNVYVIRLMALEAVQQEYAVVFPEYFVGTTNNVSNHPGTIAYSPGLRRAMLEETTAEMARNGCRKILILNGHSANLASLQDFLSTSMGNPRGYVVYAMQGGPPRMSPLTEETARLPVALRPSSLTPTATAVRRGSVSFSPTTPISSTWTARTTSRSCPSAAAAWTCLPASWSGSPGSRPFPPATLATPPERRRRAARR